MPGKVVNTAYLAEQVDEGGIAILQKDGRVLDISVASNFASIKSLGQYVSKFYLAYPKSIDK